MIFNIFACVFLGSFILLFISVFILIFFQPSPLEPEKRDWKIFLNIFIIIWVVCVLSGIVCGMILLYNAKGK